MKQTINRYTNIVIEGNIGSGKTSLATKISRQFGFRLILEEFADNPFLPDFYSNPVRYAFPLELSFLAERYHQLKEKFKQPELFSTTTISDYLFVKSLIFARINLSEDEYELYRKLFNIMDLMLPRPDILVYLHNETENLLRNIARRGRSYEQQITADYLNRVHSSYMDFFRQSDDMKILVLSTANLDFIKDENDYNLLLDYIGKDYKAGINSLILK
ncbi:MAG: deoxynucleoside kinase [Bacteroidia bacterium]